MAEKTLSLAGTAAVGFLMESSPRLHSTMDAPLANPMFLSDAPHFIQRQRARAAKALVSEHVCTVTCRCRQCSKAARSRLVPESGLPWPASMKNFVGDFAPGGAVPSTAPPGPPAPTATKLDEARKQIRYAREAHDLPEPVETEKGKTWREAAFRHHRCLAELRAREQELSQLQAASLHRTVTEETLGVLTRKQQEVDCVAGTAGEAEEALDRVEAEYQDSEGDMTGTLTSDPHSLHSVTMQPKGFVWFLRVAAACARAEEAPVPDYYADLEQKNTRPTNILESFIPPEGQSGSLEDVLGIRIPDTVVLQKGKPQRRYSLDAQGRVQVTHMKTSAELLRVLRDFVRKAIKPRIPAANLALQAMGCSKGGTAGRRKTASFATGLPPASAGPQSGPSKTAPQRSRSDGALKSRVALGSISDILGPGAVHSANPMTEVAVLYYSGEEEDQPEDLLRSRLYLGQPRPEDRTAVRLMTYAEAIAQMKGVSKLPRAFWQHIGVLQTPVQSSHVGVPTRYITYNYDQALAGEIDPQEPVPLGGLQVQPGQEPVPRDEASRVAAVPRKVNEQLLRCKKGQWYLSLVSGQFEFVLDEADGTLWLVNASKLVIERRQEAKKKDPKVEEVRYFEEEEFAQLMREEDLRLSQNITRFVNQDPATPKSPDGMPTFTLNAADRLANVRVPQELYTFYLAENEMLRYYKDEVLPEVEKKQGLSDGRGKAVSLHAWFRWWARAAGIRGRRAMRRRSDAEDREF